MESLGCSSSYAVPLLSSQLMGKFGAEGFPSLGMLSIHPAQSLPTCSGAKPDKTSLWGQWIHMGIFPKLLPSAYSKLNSVSAFGLLPAGSLWMFQLLCRASDLYAVYCKIGWFSFFLSSFFFFSPNSLFQSTVFAVSQKRLEQKPWQYDVPPQNDLVESRGKSWLLHLPAFSPLWNLHRSPPGTSREPAGL